MNKEKTIESMFASGAHFGLGKSRRHPSLSTYIFGTKNGTDIFDLEKTQALLEKAKAFVASLAKDNKTILFVGGKKEAFKTIRNAAGCGYDIFSHEPHLVIDMGGGLIELSIISGGGIVSQKALKTAGEHMNKLIGNYTYLKHGLVLGESTCEDLKIKLLNFTNEEKTINVRGKSLETGLPKTVKLKSSDVREALISQFHHIIDAAKELIELSPPEVADAIFKNGIALTGNMASIPGIEQYFVQELQIDTFVVEHYMDATIHGLMKLDRDPETIYRLVGN
jgi:rod shape-determining protein MreB